MKNTFLQRKKSMLSKIDKSSKGYWDKKIIPLCKKINSMEIYYTTSSCSGRVVLMIDSNKKEKNLFIKIYHDLINFKQMKSDLKKIKNKNLIKFKQEPCIMHVACKTLKDAQNFYDKARLAGWKKQGIISSKTRFIVEIHGTDKLEFPIIKDGKILVTDEFLKLIVKKSNENLKKSWEKIGKLKKLF